MGAMPLAAELARRRRSLFVDRTVEQAMYAAILAERSPRFHLLYVQGAGGSGKSALLRVFRDRAEAAGVRAALVSGTEVPPEADAFAAAVRAGFAAREATSVERSAGEGTGRLVLLVDAYERLRPQLDGWLREAFLPQLPESAAVVLADRQGPALAWRRDPGWQGAVTSLRLENLSAADSHAYLRLRQVPEARAEEIVAFALGHPLALALAADGVLQAPEVPFRPDCAPELVSTLLREMVERVAFPEQRAALEAAALVRCLDEPLLAALLGAAEARELFEWLGGLSIVQAGPHGLRLHETVQGVLAAESRWRNGPRYADLLARARAHCARRLGETAGDEQQRVLADYLFLHRDGPAGRTYRAIAAREGSGLVARRAEARERGELVEWVGHWEGSESAALASAWMAAQPEGAVALLDAAGGLQGGALLINPAGAPAAVPDPCLQALRAASAPAVLVRHWLAADGYQSASPAQGVLFVAFLQHYLAVPDLRFSFIVCQDTAFWEPLMRGCGFQPLPDGRFRVGDRTYGLFAREWRALSPLAWLQLLGSGPRLAAMESGGGALGATGPDRGRETPMGDQLFATAVREALRHVREPDVLARSPLLWVPPVSRALPADAAEPARVQALQGALQTAAAALADSPRRAKLHRALMATYWGTAATQEEAAELLALPFSTYRGHLKAAGELVVATLWRRHQAAFEGVARTDADSARSRQRPGSASSVPPRPPAAC